MLRQPAGELGGHLHSVYCDRFVLVVEDNDLEHVGRPIRTKDEQAFLAQLGLGHSMLDSMVYVGIVDTVPVS